MSIGRFMNYDIAIKNLLCAVFYMCSIVSSDAQAQSSKFLYAGNSNSVSISNTSEWNANGFTDVIIQDVQIPKSYKHTSEYTHKFEYAAVVLRGSGWTYDEVVKRAVRAEEIYSQCNVWIEGIQIFLTDQSNESRAFSHKEKTDLIFTKNIPIKSRPMIIYFNDDKDRNIAYAVPRKNRKSQHPYINTIWMSIAIKTLAYQKLLPNTYSDEAHELGHLLLNTTKHVFSNEENFMHEIDNLATDRINTDQCEIIRNSPLVSLIKDTE